MPASVDGDPVTLVLRTTLLSTMLTSVVLIELIDPCTSRFPLIVKSPAIVTSSGSPIVTADDSDPDPDTVISPDVPVIVEI